MSTEDPDTNRILRIDEVQVSPHFLDGRADVREIVLTDRVQRIGNFAFYRCTGLKKLSLSDSVKDCGDGILRGCTGLRLLDVSVRHGSFSVIRDLLADSDAEYVVRIHIAGEDGMHSGTGTADNAAAEDIRKDHKYTELLLVFPGFVSIAEENTMARQINFDIRGSGMGYRETVKRREIRLREYDSLFAGAAVDNIITGAKVALGRLLFPAELSVPARAKYETFLREHTRDVLLWLAGGRVLTRTEDRAMDLHAAAVAAEPDPDAPAPGEPVLAEYTAAELAAFLRDHNLCRTDDPEAAEGALKVASRRSDPELCAALLECGSGGRKKEGPDFVL